MRRLSLCAFVLLVLTPLVAGAEQITIWNSSGVTFSSPFTDSVVATSSTIANSPFENGIKLYVDYVDVQHSGAVANVCDCEIFAVIEQEIATGVWVPIANQFEAYRILDNSPQRILIFSPQFVSNPGVDEVVQQPGGGDLRISNTHGVAPSNMRIRIIVNEYTSGVLNSVTVTAYAERFTE